MATELAMNGTAADAVGYARLERAHTNQFAERARRSAPGSGDAVSFRAHLESLVRNEVENGGLKKLSAEAVRSQTDAGGAQNPAGAPRDTMSELVSLGRYNEAAMINVGHFTGDLYMLRSALNVYRENKESEVEPVQAIDEYVGG